MIIGVPKEIKNNENRVGLTPAGVAELRKHGHTLLVQTGAGSGSGFDDAEYVQAGAQLLPAIADVYEQAEMIIKVKEPIAEEYPLIKENQLLFTYFHFASGEELTHAMIERKAICLAYETVELPSRALPLLIPMSEVAGRMAPQEGAKYLEKPLKGRGILLGGVRRWLGPDADLATHFTPRYNPWEQRLCLVPDGDFFKAVRTGRASVVTDTIERFTETGIALTSGAHLDADIVVTATGLALELAGGLQVSVDGVPVDWPNTLNYKGLMYSGVPNFAAVFGYTNASWTLKADLISEYVCRLLNHMAEHGLRQCTPRNGDPGMATEPWVDFSSGYLQREMHRFPKQGSRGPWKLNQNYLRDLFALRYGRLDDGAMTFA